MYPPGSFVGNIKIGPPSAKCPEHNKARYYFTSHGDFKVFLWDKVLFHMKPLPKFQGESCQTTGKYYGLVL